ncbi:MAG: hypothetical protein B7O98_05635 [Zestosphaera tikiterensis]|uniref:CARDB domain-containing protein n=1 Tax=Zestosphaera tikiterensis TaxID=1973259 RepID=A0A2R7Y3V1_9CREN|nr:MAG: hypothetical protein B7O98_05635 [Zestosphaera tikiterensis]
MVNFLLKFLKNVMSFNGLSLGRIKTSIIFVLMFITLVNVMFTALYQTTSAEELVVLPNHMGRINALGYYVVYGEIENRGSSAASNIIITVTFFDASGNVIGEKIGSPFLDVLPAGAKSPFELYLSTAAASKVSSYKFDVKYTTTNPKPEKLKILSSKTQIYIDQKLSISGEIENTGDSKADIVKVAVACYDEAGRVITATETYIYEIGPHEKTNYEVVVEEWWLTKNIRSYSLYVESLEYAMIPSSYDHAPVSEISSSTSVSSQPSPTSLTTSSLTTSGSYASPALVEPSLVGVAFLTILCLSFLFYIMIKRRPSM